MKRRSTDNEDPSDLEVMVMREVGREMRRRIAPHLMDIHSQSSLQRHHFGVDLTHTKSMEITEQEAYEAEVHAQDFADDMEYGEWQDRQEDHDD